MASSWSGKLYVLRGGDGKYHIGITLPTGLIDSSSLSVYDAAGPYPPTGFPGSIAVDDLAAWMTQQQQAGFVFTPGTL